MRRVLPSLLLVGVLGLYAGAYLSLRAGHFLVHESNARHPHPEKRDTRHDIAAYGAGGHMLEVVFWPLIQAERGVHQLND